jgi:hypothetical protein
MTTEEIFIPGQSRIHKFYFATLDMQKKGTIRIVQ